MCSTLGLGGSEAGGSQPLEDLRGIQDRVGRRPGPPVCEPVGLPDEIAAYLAAFDGDYPAQPPIDPDTEQPLYVPADWSQGLADWSQGLADWSQGLADWVPECDEPTLAEDTRPAGDSWLPTDLQLALPGLGVNASRMPRPGDGARTDYGGHLCSAAARRLACDSAIYRIVLGPGGIPLSAGRRTRLVPPTLRRVLVARDGGCRFPGCDRPPAYTQAHHVQFWADGGPTSSTNLVLLCGFHHHRVHDDGWHLQYDPATNTVTVQRPDGTPLRLPGEP